MTISLPAELERLVQRQLESGRFSAPTEVVAAALRLLAAQEELREAIAVGIEQADCGEVAPFRAADTLARVKAARAAGFETE